MQVVQDQKKASETVASADANEYQDFLLPIPPGGPWALARRVSESDARAFIWKELEPTARTLAQPLLSAGWEFVYQLGPASIVTRTAYRYTRDWFQNLVLFGTLMFLTIIGWFFMFFYRYKGYEPAALRVSMRRTGQATEVAESAPGRFIAVAPESSVSLPPQGATSAFLAFFLEYIIPGAGMLYAGVRQTALLWFGVGVGLFVLIIIGAITRSGGLAEGGLIAYLAWTALRSILVVHAVDHNNAMAQHNKLMENVSQPAG